jgi:hypothetical protein
VISVADIHLAEYKALKDEQRDRIRARDNLPYITLTVFAAVTFFAFGQTSTHYPALLLLPVACFILGWTHLANDRKVDEIGHYFREHLTPALALPGADTPLLAWETSHRNGPRRRYRKIIQAGVDLLSYCGTASAAVFAYLVVTPTTPAFLVVACILELAGVLLLALEILRGMR